MSSNSKRTKQQLTAIPAMLGALSAILWPISWGAAQATGWVSAAGGTFTDIWFGAVTVVTFIGAAGATLGFVITAVDGAWEWIRE